jgi:hypothetical protein
VVPGLAVIGVLLLAGCASVGPPTITRDRFDYVTAISESWKRQMLLNVLKVRYADAPVFMDGASVISAYAVEGEISFSGQYAPIGRGDAFGNVGATGRYADKPTITYQPLIGDKFARSMMAPIPVTGILFLLQSGYPADLVLRVCVNAGNGLENDYGGSGNPRAGSPKFRELMAAMQAYQADGSMGFRVKAGKDKQVAVMFIRPPTDQTAAPSHNVRELLGLNPDAREFSIENGSVGRGRPGDRHPDAVDAAGVDRHRLDHRGAGRRHRRRGRLRSAAVCRTGTHVPRTAHRPPWRVAARRRLRGDPVPQAVVLDRRPRPAVEADPLLPDADVLAHRGCAAPERTGRDDSGQMSRQVFLFNM